MGVVCSKEILRSDKQALFMSSDLFQHPPASVLSPAKLDAADPKSPASDVSSAARLPRNELPETARMRDLELRVFHQKFDTYQYDYFNKKELEYYRKILKNEEQTVAKQPKQKRIDCKEDKLLGCGSFGTVTLGLDVNNLRIMAVKRVYIGSGSEHSAALKEIQEESQLLSELKHKNIVTYFGSEREKEFLKIYMEYIEGGSLASLLKTFGSFQEPLVARYTRQLLSGLEYLHYHNVVHRDIKGANILVTRNGVVKLSDFGSAKRICSYEQSMIGTIAYMAPEVIASKGYNWFADIWSLGCTVFEMLTGKPPFTGSQVT